MKIAILGWGSLVWNPRDLKLLGSSWHPDGPLLPIEFARISGSSGPQQRLTLVLRDGAPNVRTLWAQSAYDDFDCARDDLGLRENLPTASRSKLIGYVKGDGTSQLTSIHDSTTLTAQLQEWRARHGFDAVIWADIASNFEESQKSALTPASAIAYLRNLIQNKSEAAAEEYVRRAPAQVRTEIREQIEVTLGWLPPSIEPPLASGSIQSTDDLRAKEWAECRTTIGRLDTILADLRKLGFSLITGLLTASAFLGLVGVQAARDVAAPPAEVRAAVFMVIMVLIAALFSVDSYYQVLLSAAVERALDLEVKTDPSIRISKYLSVNASHTKAVYVTMFLYLLLLATSVGLGLLATGGLGLAANGPSALLRQATAAAQTGSGLMWLLPVVVFSVLFFVVRHYAGRPNRWVLAIAVGVALWFTGGLGAFMLGGAGKSIAAAWVVVLGMLLAMCMEIYWLYVAWRSGLHRNKLSRQWPEGEEKVA